LARAFGYKIESLPFTYLGLPLGTTKPRVDHFEPLMSKTERKLTATSNFLTHAGRLQLVNSVLSSLPTFAMCTLQVPATVLDYIDRARRHCLWRGSDSNAKMKPLVAWKKCAKPKRKGGLGIINLRSQNNALLLKHLDKFYNKKEIPWVKLIWNAHYPIGQVPHAITDRGSFWWRDILKLCDLFRGIAECKIGDGSTVLFWSDLWNDNILQTKYPRLFFFAKNKNITVAQFCQTTPWDSSPYLRTGISRVLKHSRLYSNNSSSSQYKRFLAIHLGKQDLLFLKVLQSPLQERPTSCSVHLGLGFQMFQ